MSGKGKGARGKGRGKAQGNPPSVQVVTRKSKKKELVPEEHVGGQAPKDDAGGANANAKQQEPGPSREGKRKRQTTLLKEPEEPESSEIESGESDSEWQGTSKWQHNVPQSIETPDFVNLSVPPSFKRLMWGGGLHRFSGFHAKPPYR